MKETIKKLLTEFIAIPSVSCTRDEIQAAEYIRDYFSGLEYFQKNPQFYGLYDIPDDPYDRKVAYGFIKGNSDNTVVLMGHIDVVGVEDYGEAIPLAYSMGEELEQVLAGKALPPDARKDMESGDWEWGRGVMDMKAGVIIHLALMEEYAKKALEGSLDGNIFFMGVPDEESYSAGMRAGVTLLSEYKDTHKLHINLMIDGEPCSVTDDNEMIFTIGSVGKVMPVVMVQGVTAHVGHRFAGITPLGILSRMELKTDESLVFTDSYEGEATMPPTWANMRDMKRKYDVSIPLRASGYMTVLSFQATPDVIMGELKRIAKESFEESVEALNNMYQEFKKLNKFERKEKIYYEPLILSYADLTARLREEKGEAFDAFYQETMKKIEAKVLSSELNYQEATVELMEETLNFADIKQPLVLIAFAPPYYLAINSDLMPGHEGSGSQLFHEATEFMKRYDRTLVKENYALGISDMSYGGMDHPFDTGAFSKNTPIWGKLYNIDFESIANLNMPCIFLGPIGKDPHQWTERTLKKSLYEEAPELNKYFIDKYLREKL
ncbi:MAG: M20/M25/M40 family metallo-hydrolase [Firmicutes bacterium]|nr:M20/M25/M40 family metallo-hydrolase [Bacillota bacterium]